MENHRKGILYAAATASLWGFMAIILKVITHEIPSMTVVWFRFFLAFVTLSAWTLVFRRRDFAVFRNPPFLLILAALFLGFNYTGFISGIKYISPSSAQVFIQVGPVGFAVAGIIIFREKVNWKHLIGFAGVLTGIILFYSEQLRSLDAGGAQFTGGMLLVLGGGISWAAFAAIQKKLLETLPPNQLNLFIYGFCAAALLPAVRFGGLHGLTPVSWILLVYLGLNTVLAYGSLALAIRYTEATRVSVIITLNPVITFFTMAILSRWEVTWIEPEHFSFSSIAGALLVLGGAITVISAKGGGGGRLKKNRKG